MIKNNFTTLFLREKMRKYKVTKNHLEEIKKYLAERGLEKQLFETQEGYVLKVENTYDIDKYRKVKYLVKRYDLERFELVKYVKKQIRIKKPIADKVYIEMYKNKSNFSSEVARILDEALA
jgi:hypothetical protein